MSRNYFRKLKNPTILAVFVILVFTLCFYIIPTNRAVAEDTCPAMSPRAGCRGPWPIWIKDKSKDPKESPAQVKERNERKVADAINNYIKLNAWGTSRLFEINNGDPGMTFLKVGEAQKINPLFLVAMTGAETHYATLGASMECGNPFGQPPTAKNPVCTAKDGSKWYEYNKEHKLDEDMLNDQAQRIWYTYVNDPHIRSLEDFLEAYTPLAQNPYRDTPQSQCNASMGVRCGAKDRYINALETIKRDSQDVVLCSAPGGGNGCDLIDYSNPPLPLGSSEMQALKENIEFYKQIASQADVPCEMLVSIAYRENGFSTAGSLLNGGAYGNSEDANSCAGNTTKESDYLCGAQFLDSKVGGALTANTKDPALIKDAFWGWNGRSQDSADESNYVANFWHGDGATPQFRIRGTVPGGGYVDRPDTQLGTFALYKWLIGEWPMTAL